MEGIPVRYKRATAPLDDTARARLWENGSGGGTEPSSSMENSPELSELVDSFYDQDEEEGLKKGRRGIVDEEDGAGSGEFRKMLKVVLNESELDPVAARIRDEADVALRANGSDGVGPTWRVMARLRDKGFDAGVCKSSWDKSSRLPAGCHDYIDVISRRGHRYIVEINVIAEFEIARPTDEYRTLLKNLPRVLVARPDALKAIVRLMCMAAKESLKSMGMPVPPWRRREYMQGKWFSSHKRTIPRVSMKAVAGDASPSTSAMATGVRKSVGIVAKEFCRMEFVRREGPIEGRLVMAFKGM